MPTVFNLLSLRFDAKMPASSRFRSNRFRLLVTFGFFLGGFYEIIASTHVYQISQSGNNPVIYSNLPKTNNKNKKPINYFKMPVIEAAMKYQLPSSLMRSVPMNIWDDVSNASCYSSSNEDSTADFEGTRSWEQRLPFVIVIGAQKGGSSALAKYLYEHPSIAPSSKELHFLAYQIDHQLNGTVRYSDYVQRMKKALKMKLEEFQANQNLHFLDATPNYMFFSDRVPQRLLCLCPWAKLLVVLRNPVDRAMSQYSMQFHKLKRSKQANYSFAEWIRHDYQVLTGLGVLRNHSSHEEFERFSGSQEEMDGWKVYTKLGLNSPIGKLKDSTDHHDSCSLL